MIKILKYGEVKNEDIFARSMPKMNVEGIVAEIIDNVKKNKDKALFDYCKKFDKANLSSLVVSEEEINEAVSSVEPEFLEILQAAANNIKKFHEKQKRNSFIINDEKGIIIGQKIIPVDRAGLYVPGGTAAYPSTVLMDSIPAKLAGVREVVIVTPPNSEGKINPVILAAASVAGVDRIFKVGGAQAIAALAYGTETIPKVDKIVGPGNAFVAEAKKQVFGKVSIDMIAGPSEILIVADSKTDPAYAAADLLSQAEHDKLASAVLVTDSEDLAAAVSAELEQQIPLLERAEIARASIDDNGKIIVADTLERAIEIANEIKPHKEFISLKNSITPVEVYDYSKDYDSYDELSNQILKDQAYHMGFDENDFIVVYFYLNNHLDTFNNGSYSIGPNNKRGHMGFIMFEFEDVLYHVVLTYVIGDNGLLTNGSARIIYGSDAYKIAKNNDNMELAKFIDKYNPTTSNIEQDIAALKNKKEELQKQIHDINNQLKKIKK